MCINFNITLLGPRGMLKHICDCLYITDNMSEATDQILTKPTGITHLFVLFWHIALDWSDGGTTSFVYLLLIGPKGAAFVGGDIFIALF